MSVTKFFSTERNRDTSVNDIRAPVEVKGFQTTCSLYTAIKRKGRQTNWKKVERTHFQPSDRHVTSARSRYRQFSSDRRWRWLVGNIDLRVARVTGISPPCIYTAQLLNIICTVRKTHWNSNDFLLSGVGLQLNGMLKYRTRNYMV